MHCRKLFVLLGVIVAKLRATTFLPFEGSAGDCFRDGEQVFQVQRGVPTRIEIAMTDDADASGSFPQGLQMLEALDRLKIFWERASRVGVIGHRDFNPGWHTALDLKNLLTVSEAITRAALVRKESRGAQFRDDYPEKDERLSNVNTIIRKAGDGSMEVRLEPLPEMPEYLKQIVEEMK